MYQEAVAQSRLVDVRAGQVFVEGYVACQEARYWEQYGEKCGTGAVGIARLVGVKGTGRRRKM